MARSKKLENPLWTVIQDQGFAKGDLTKANVLEVFEVASESQEATVREAGGQLFEDRPEASTFARCVVGQDVQGRFVKIVIKTRRYFVFAPLRGRHQVRHRKPARQTKLRPQKTGAK